MKDIPITIGIVTFKERKELVKKLITDIRSLEGEQFDLLLMVNGNNEEEMDDEYRSEMLDFCSTVKRCYPYFYPEFKSLSKLWNNCVVFSKTNYNFIICDDVFYKSPDVLTHIRSHINKTQEEFFKINNQFSFFVVTKEMLHRVGYFDERLIAHGNEDGDIIYRYQDLLKKNFPSVRISGLENGACYDLQSNLVDYTHRKPTVNLKIMIQKYETGTGGMEVMTAQLKKRWPDEKQYPYEMFIWKNKHNIRNFTSIETPHE